MTGPRVAVLGCGANGATIAADLTRAGHDVVLIDQWPAHVEAMRTHGITQVMREQTLVTKVRAFNLCDVCTFTGQFDIVLLSCKAYDTRWHSQLIEPYLAPEGLLAGVQNGMTIEAISDVVGSHRSMGAVIEISSTMFDPGIVRRDSPPERSWFAVGSTCEETCGRESEVASLLSEVGKAEIVDDIRATKWMKLVSNATTLVTTAILGLPMQEAMHFPGMRELMLRSGQEALDAGVLQGYDVLPIFGLKPPDVEDREHLVEKLLDTLMGGFVLPETTTTVLQDWTKGRRSEVDDLNGLVVNRLERAGKRAPVNRAIVEVAHRIERRQLTPDVGNLPRLLALIESLIKSH
ncbi:ketopantoate reductase family protein [Paraburkholderia sp. DHOC27]|uniref:ketopantoate reductase family protein n=1 Tax=Paraburkholderia sp. DHOC27 TaxID=2303330 RepID=UPI000E3DD750|nr:2-dehydropantoate 2-reductase N-terminal domain-containing protein [Paraburkholderia sp. DHOC27]RFU49108.1 ketopantoate reductase family protein [Paraburkholderia sp. DHOC27]